MHCQTLMDAAISNSTDPVTHRWRGIGDGHDGLPAATFGLQLITTGTLQGAWQVSVTNRPTAQDDGVAGADITSAFTPSIAAVTGPSNQLVQLIPLNAAFVRATFVPTSGSGSARVNQACLSWVERPDVFPNE